jgi:type II secretory pathway pseudopilin PulG
MQNPGYRSHSGSGRRTALISLGLIGAMMVGLIGFWWTAAMKTPVVAIPTPTLPNPNAFDFYVAAGNAVVNDKQIGYTFYKKPMVVYTLAQKEVLVQQNLGVINTLHKGFAYPYVNPPARSFDVLFPYFAKFRSVARLLSLRGQVQSQRGDWSGATDSYLDAIRMGEDVPHGSILIGELVGIACQAIGRRPMWGVVEHLNAAQSRAAAARLQGIIERHFSYADTMQEEKWFGQAGLLEVMSNTKKRNALFTPADTTGSTGTASVQSMTVLLYLAYNKSRIMNNYTNYMDANRKLVQQPYGLHLPPPPLPNDPFTSVIVPAFTQARMKDVDSETQNGLLLLTLALHAYRLEHGRYPASLTELTPAYLKRLPDDPFAVQGTFKYLAKGKNYVLYSVGPDGKDDGGTPIDDPKQASGSNPNARYFINENSVGDVVAGKNVY